MLCILLLVRPPLVFMLWKMRSFLLPIRSLILALLTSNSYRNCRLASSSTWRRDSIVASSCVAKSFRTWILTRCLTLKRSLLIVSLLVDFPRCRYLLFLDLYLLRPFSVACLVERALLLGGILFLFECCHFLFSRLLYPMGFLYDFC